MVLYYLGIIILILSLLSTANMGYVLNKELAFNAERGHFLVRNDTNAYISFNTRKATIYFRNVHFSHFILAYVRSMEASRLVDNTNILTQPIWLVILWPHLLGS